MSSEFVGPPVHPRLKARRDRVEGERLDRFEERREDALALLEEALGILSRYRSSIGPDVVAPIEAECRDMVAGVRDLQAGDAAMPYDADQLAARLEVVLNKLDRISIENSHPHAVPPERSDGA